MELSTMNGRNMGNSHLNYYISFMEIWNGCNNNNYDRVNLMNENEVTLKLNT